MLTFAVDRIDFKFERHPLLVPFKIGNKPPMTELETIRVEMHPGVLGQQSGGTRGLGCATLANVWAGVELEAMKDLAPAIRNVLIGREFSHPLGLYHETRGALMALVGGGVNQTAVEVVFSAFDAAVWDFFGRAYYVHPCQTLTNEFLGDDLLGYYGGTGFEDVIRLKPRKVLLLMYTHGGAGRLFALPDVPLEVRATGLIATCRNEGRKVVKVKCGGDIETDIREVLSVHALTGAKLWLDYNGSSKEVYHVVNLLEMLKALAPRVFEAILAIEQPLSPQETFTVGNHVGQIADLKPVYIDESALDIASVKQAKIFYYTGVVGKTGKGMSATLEMARAAKMHGMLFSMQDLTNIGPSFSQSIGTAAHIKNLAHGLVEGNQGQFLRVPDPAVHITKGQISTSNFIGPGFF